MKITTERESFVTISNGEDIVMSRGEEGGLATLTLEKGTYQYFKDSNEVSIIREKPSRFTKWEKSKTIACVDGCAFVDLGDGLKVRLNKKDFRLSFAYVYVLRNMFGKYIGFKVAMA